MTQSSFDYKVNIVSKLLNKNNADAIIFISTYNRFWITGVNTTFGYAIVTKKDVYLVIDARDYECCKNSLTNVKCVLYNSFNDLKALVNKLKIKKLLFENDYVSYLDFNNVLKKLNNKLIPINTCILRAQKTPEEIANIRKSMDIAA